MSRSWFFSIFYVASPAFIIACWNRMIHYTLYVALYHMHFILYHKHVTFYCMHGLVSLFVGVIFMPHILPTILYIPVSANSSLLSLWSLILSLKCHFFLIFYFYLSSVFFSSFVLSVLLSQDFYIDLEIKLSLSLVCIYLVFLAFGAAMSSFLNCPSFNCNNLKLYILLNLFNIYISYMKIMYYIIIWKLKSEWAAISLAL